MKNEQLRAKVIVDYIREAYICPYGMFALRLTNICGRA
jgi:hypothetical protein